MTVDIAALRALDAAAESPSPWSVDDDDARSDVPVVCIVSKTEMIAERVWHRDAALIVAMRNALPGLLDEIEAYRELGPIAAGPNVMDGAAGPVCGCGSPSVDESGWCGREHLDTEIESLRAWCQWLARTTGGPSL